MARLDVFVVSFILLRLRRNAQDGRTRKNTLAGCRIQRRCRSRAAFFSRSRFSSPKAAELRRLQRSAKRSD
jgi:hypothetical protein